MKTWFGIAFYQSFEFRCVGGEIHRRPINRECKTPWDAAWLVLRAEEVPEEIKKVKPYLSDFPREFGSRLRQAAVAA